MIMKIYTEVLHFVCAVTDLLAVYLYHVKPMRFCVLCVVMWRTLGW